MGSSLYHWTHGNEHYLFTSHVVNRVEDDWRVDLDLWQYGNLRDWGDLQVPPDPPSQIAAIAQMPLDYTMPNMFRHGTEEFHAFSDDTRASFTAALGAQLEAESKHVLPS